MAHAAMRSHGSSQTASRKNAAVEPDAEPGAAASKAAKQACASAEVGARIAIGVEAPVNDSVEWPGAIYFVKLHRNGPRSGHMLEGPVLETRRLHRGQLDPAQLTPGMQLDAAALRNHIPLILAAFVRDLRTPQTPGQQRVKSEGRAPAPGGPESAAAGHGRMRAQDGFGVNQMVAEYRAMRASVLRLWTADRALTADSIEDMIRFNEAIDQALAESLVEFTAEVDKWRNIFLGALGHDLRGPLAAVVLTTDVLATKLQDPRLAPLVERIASSAARTTKLLDDLLQYSRSGLGVGMSIDRRECDLRDELREETEILRAALPEVAITLDHEGCAKGHFDASRLREAIHNLVTNAAKYGDPESEIGISIVGQPQHLAIAVTNRGPALPAGSEAAMFDPLRRGPTAAATGEATSMGLGLFIVREVVLAHGGVVEARSGEGRTCFEILLPRRAGDALPEAG